MPLWQIESLDKLRLENIVKRYDDWVLQLDLHLRNGEIMTLLGPSGCGKTTTLRIIAGFIQVDRGHIFLDNTIIDDVPPYLRNIGVVFQDYALFPHLNVFKNIAFGMRIKKTPKAEIDREVTRLLALVKMEGLGERRPHQLSGGQQQRVALARALSLHPKILLLDEPLSNLDANLRVKMREEIRRLQRRLGLTIIFVTHDVEEAVFLADRIILFSARPARIRQDIDVASILGGERTLATRENQSFFKLRNDVLHLIRNEAGLVR